MLGNEKVLGAASVYCKHSSVKGRSAADERPLPAHRAHVPSDPEVAPPGARKAQNITPGGICLCSAQIQRLQTRHASPSVSSHVQNQKNPCLSSILHLSSYFPSMPVSLSQGPRWRGAHTRAFFFYLRQCNPPQPPPPPPNIHIHTHTEPLPGIPESIQLSKMSRMRRERRRAAAGRVLFAWNGRDPT